MKKLLSLSLLLVLFIPSTSLAQVTPQQSCTILTTDLQLGMSDATTNGAITSLQNYLKSYGSLSVQPTGYFGNLTLLAVKKFQSLDSIPSTGYVGPLTRLAIKGFSCSQSSNATPTVIASTSASTNSATVSTTSSIPGCAAGDTYSVTTGAPCATIVTAPQSQTLPTPTATQIAQVTEYCNDVQNQRVVYNNGGNTQIIQECNDGAILNAYVTDGTARNTIDSIVQQVLSSPQQTVAQCEQTLRTGEAGILSMILPGSSGYMSAEASIAETCGDTATAAYDQAQAQSEQSSQTAAQILQQQEQIQQLNNSLQQIQQQQQEQQQEQEEQKLQQESEPNCSLSNIIQNGAGLPGCIPNL